MSAAVRVVLPWSMCPMVPTLTCGLLRSNFSLAMSSTSFCDCRLPSRCGRVVMRWSRCPGSNWRPRPYQGRALPTELHRHSSVIGVWSSGLAQSSRLIPMPCRFSNWSGRRGSNPRPTAWKAVTLPLSYSRQFPDLHSLANWRLVSLVNLLVEFIRQITKSPTSTKSPVRTIGGEGRTRTFEAARATDLQSAAFDRFATSPAACVLETRCFVVLEGPDVLAFSQWSWRRDSNPRPADYKSAALPT